MTLKRTPLYETHKKLGARLVDFAGWEMPVQYTGVKDEHKRVRTTCGLFDVSHMGEVEVTGPGALDAVQRLTTNDASKLVDGQCQYTLICYPTGGVVDDCLVYRLGPERFLFCVNASNTAKAFEWIRDHAGEDAEVKDATDDYALIALQGPASIEVMGEVTDGDPGEIKSFHFAEMKVAGVETIVSRTGYTGEDGFELYLAPEGATKVWDALAKAGEKFDIAPAGLGARDTLRLEAGLPLYGQELDPMTTPVEAGLHGRFVSFDKPLFIGKEVLERQYREGPEKTLVGIELTASGIARTGYELISDGEVVGRVTSGTISPTLGKAVAMAYVRPGFTARGTEIKVRIRGREVDAKVVKRPFYNRKSAAPAG